MKMNQSELYALLTLSGFPILGFKQIENQYWPDAPAYAEVIASSPWFVLDTEWGPVTIGWRKRVLSISWAKTNYRLLDINDVTSDETTKDHDMVHAWSYGDAVKYLEALHRCFKRLHYLKTQEATQPKP